MDIKKISYDSNHTYKKIQGRLKKEDDLLSKEKPAKQEKWTELFMIMCFILLGILITFNAPFLFILFIIGLIILTLFFI